MAEVEGANTVSTKLIIHECALVLMFADAMLGQLG